MDVEYAKSNAWNLMRHCVCGTWWRTAFDMPYIHALPEPRCQIQVPQQCKRKGETVFRTTTLQIMSRFCMYIYIYILLYNCIIPFCSRHVQTVQLCQWMLPKVEPAWALVALSWMALAANRTESSVETLTLGTWHSEGRSSRCGQHECCTKWPHSRALRRFQGTKREAEERPKGHPRDTQGRLKGDRIRCAEREKMRRKGMKRREFGRVHCRRNCKISHMDTASTE